MTDNDREILAVAGMSSAQKAWWSRLFDILVVPTAALLILAVISLHFILSVGDWDFFIDFKDRQYWILLTPIATIMIVTAWQAIFWIFFRLPVGATATALLLLVATWIVRYHSWYGWVYFPISLVVPATILAGAMALDAVLVLTRTWVLTGVFGGLLYGMLFYPSNWVALAPYFLPVEHMGEMASVADVIGYSFPRAGTPEYIRIIERGTLRTFEGITVWISSFFAGFVCIFMYYLWWWIGYAFSTVRYIPTGKVFRKAFGIA